ncbi:MAG: chromosome segregation SMC family protein [Candidatus Aenigmarchaeota archaeon]|nr:chromosome segregation SMC family protein [Candidatus Aenigmarchaeota archaeon]
MADDIVAEVQKEAAAVRDKSKTMITRVTMQGFKSFNKRVSVPLLRGFNIFCGPNGVGKSNIVDAICFVLGRTSAKSMRADRLHELIFHGGEGRASAKLAAVTLYLDNTPQDGHAKPFEYDDTEISVTRKVNTKGVSIYKLNGRTTTRQRILELMSGARIQPDGHNIVMQGDIMQIIEMNPIERRGIIDDISGIADYNDKKAKAGKDLEVVDQKLREAEILITERYERFKRLENERNSAVRYQALQKEMLMLRASLAHKIVTTIEADMVKMDEELQKRQQQVGQADDAIEAVEGELEKREGDMRDMADKLIDMSKRMGEEQRVSELRSRMLVAKNTVDSKRHEIDAINSLVERLESFETRKTESSESYGGGVPRPVQAVLRQKLRGVYGTVADLIRVPEKYSIAIEVAAARHMYDVVVESDDVASYCIEYLKRERLGRATFIPLNKIKPGMLNDVSGMGKDGVHGVASTLIKYDTAVMRAIEFVFGRTIVVDSLDVAKAVGIGRQRMVTLDGDLAESSGAMTGGFYIRTHPKAVAQAASDDMERNRQRRRELEEEVRLVSQDVAELEKELKKYGAPETTKEAVDMEKVRVSSETELDELRSKRRQAYEKKVRVQTELNAVSIARAKADAEIANARVELSQYGPMEYVDDTVASLQKFVRKASDELQAIGLVNMRAIEEYELFKSQFDEYKVKYEKILEEKKAVIGMMEEIESRRMETFYRCLKIVSQHFAYIFTKMTGGQASLELEDAANLESGLLIRANPAGKRMINLDLMSGGEKSLTALAFIFAIQKFRAAPFYVLDEVDAALDKENSQKIAELIKALSRDEQFIMITHNDQTIKYGDRVYGITMDRGESKILGVELPKR